MKSVSYYLKRIERSRSKRKRMQSVLSVLSVIVAMGVVWQLRLPGITMTDPTYCGLEPHAHTDACYAARGAKTLNCVQTGTVVHAHDARCYDASGAQVCMLAELEVHQHDDACYQQTEITVDPGHSHGDSCYDWTTPEQTSCGQEEAAGHAHGDTCFEWTKSDALLCNQEASEIHTHEDACFAWNKGEAVVCGQKEILGHSHSDACFTPVKGALLCEEEERDPVMGPGEPKRICEKKEIQLHTHEASCYSVSEETGEQTLVCTMPEILAHQHEDACFQEAEPELACELEENQEHTHIAQCYQLWEQICVLEEHAHTLQCTSDPQADVETAEIWEAGLAQVEKTGIWAEDLLAIARNQLGYKESQANFQVEENGGAIHGYTRYGAWYGEPYRQWDNLFAAFCIHYAGIPAENLPWDVEYGDWIMALTNAGYFHTEAEFIPAPGDLIFFDQNQDSIPDGVGVVESREENLQVIQGGTPQVTRKEYDLAEETILGYGDIHGAYAFYLTQLEQTEAPQDPLVHPVQMFADSSYTVPRSDDVAILVTGELPEGAQVYAYPVALTMEDITVLCAYDIKVFLADGTEYQPETPLTVQIHSQFPESDKAVYHLLEDGSVESVEFTEEEAGIAFEAPGFSVYAVVDTTALQSVAEAGDPEAVQALIDSGFFEYWSEKARAILEAESSPASFSTGSTSPHLKSMDKTSQQIVSEGGSASDGGVYISKTISATDTENVFDILLHVSTNTNIEEFVKEPDMAVVIVMDISNTMNESFGGSTRYKAAVEAAEHFMDEFAKVTDGISKIGYVAFNTDAHEIFPLSSCADDNEATVLKNTMRQDTGDIINNYVSGDRKRFTNIEAGLKMGYDMLAKADNDNKYIIFLSDGFPTTYVKSGYTGYNVYMQDFSPRGTPGDDGVFYDAVSGKYCLYGTSYSDKAAIRAREQAAKIKDAGAKIFSIGIDVGGQTIQKHINSEGGSHSVVDRTSQTYELGSATDLNAFKNWLGNSIGSGYYYDSTDTEGLTSAYDQIFAEIQKFNQQTSYEKWVANDPMPMTSEGQEQTVEFLGFYNQRGEYQVYPPTGSLAGSHGEGLENTASYDSQAHAIRWDLKNSGYVSTGTETNYSYNYYLRYRVRLKNERANFQEGFDYNTNGKTTLRFQEVTTTDGVTDLGPEKTLDFPYPKVEGYLGELTFQKVDSSLESKPVVGAEFTLSHDTTVCKTCRGDELSAVTIPDMVAVSGEDGKVIFQEIPSGHTYSLVETYVPTGYYHDGSTYSVTVAYDEVTVTYLDPDGQAVPWEDKIVNHFSYELPKTGGAGTLPYLLGGLLLMAAPLKYESSRRRRGRRQQR